MPCIATHPYTASGPRTVSVTAWDEWGLESQAAQQTVAVFGPPQASTLPATGIGSTSATLRADVGDLNGATTLAVAFVLETPGEAPRLVYPSPSSITAPGTVEVSVNDLVSGTPYSYRLRMQFGQAPASETSPVSFQTSPQLEVGPGIVSVTSAALGSPVSLVVDSNGTSSQNVAYRVWWGDGTYQKLGWNPADQQVTITHSYAFPRTNFKVEVGLELQSLGNSVTVSTQTSVSGAPPVSNLSLQSPRVDDAILRAAVGSLQLPGATSIEFLHRREGADVWETSGWIATTANQNHDWTTPTLVRGQVYESAVRLKATISGMTSGYAVWPQGTPYGGPDFQTNRAPTLEPLYTTPRQDSYLNQTTFAVRYFDADGDLPKDALGAASTPTLRIEDKTFPTHFRGEGTPDAGMAQSPDGVTYYYTARPSELPRFNQTRTPVFTARDAYQAAPTVL